MDETGQPPATEFDWNQVRAFLATAEAGSLSAAARALGTSQPTVGRQVAGLEADLGVILFERVGKALELTPTGRDLLAHVRAMGAAASRVALAASGRREAVSGRVSVSASDAMAAYLLPEVVAGLARAAPGLELELVASNALSDLQRREADIAIRQVRPEAPELIAKSLGEATGRLYAATRLLDRIGRPAGLADLDRLDMIGFSDAERFVAALAERGLPVRRARIRAVSDSGIVVWEMARAGLGAAVMSDAVARRTPGMEPVLPDLAPVRFPVWLVVHRELRTSRRIRLVWDHLAEVLPALV